jgi:hypothetical protein
MQKEHEMNITQERYQALVDAAKQADEMFHWVAGYPDTPASTRYYFEGKARGLALALEIINAPSVTGQALKAAIEGHSGAPVESPASTMPAPNAKCAICGVECFAESGDEPLCRPCVERVQEGVMPSVPAAPKPCGALLRLSRVGYGTCDLPAGHTGHHHCDTR